MWNKKESVRTTHRKEKLSISQNGEHIRELEITKIVRRSQISIDRKSKSKISSRLISILSILSTLIKLWFDVR